MALLTQALTEVAGPKPCGTPLVPGCGGSCRRNIRSNERRWRTLRPRRNGCSSDPLLHSSRIPPLPIDLLFSPRSRSPPADAGCMPNDIMYDLQSCGYLARTSQLAALGHGRRRIETAISDGRILRICGNWVATNRASTTAVIAVLQRGKLTGATALSSHGIWDAVDSQIHVQLRRNAHGPVRKSRTPLVEFAQGKYLRVGVRRHWSEEKHHDPYGDSWRVSVLDALIRVAHDCSGEQFLACVESALCTGKLSRAGIPILFASLPKRLQDLSALIDPLAESGLETLTRLRLSRFVRSIQSQVEIARIGPDGRAGRVDLLLDGWLAIELDGDEFHDPVADRKRNAALVRLGYRVHRFGYDQVIHGWDHVEATIRELLRYSPKN